MSVTAPDLLYSTPDMAEIPYLALELELFDLQYQNNHLAQRYNNHSCFFDLQRQTHNTP